ncbi:MAG: hypothetical protein JWM99_3603 [Verrucomicrobiales bacterium]|nr:hypothetical protein [Verrucomicrobiales bacterium]
MKPLWGFQDTADELFATFISDWIRRCFSNERLITNHRSEISTKLEGGDSEHSMHW